MAVKGEGEGEGEGSSLAQITQTSLHVQNNLMLLYL